MLKRIESTIFKFSFIVVVQILVSTGAEARSCESVGGVSSRGECLCPLQNNAINPEKQYCGENIICKDGQTLEQFLKNDGQALAVLGQKAFTIREVNSPNLQNRFFIVYLDPQKRVRFAAPPNDSGLSFDPINKQQDTDHVISWAVEIGLEQPLLKSTYCNGNFSQNMRGPNRNIIIEEPVFLESEWQNNSLISPEIKFNAPLIEANVQLLQKRTGFERARLHGAQFFHGSSSASLLAFTRYNNFKGELVPTGQLEAQQKIPFSGEIGFLRSGINSHALSTVHAGYLMNAIKYAKAESWNPIIGQKHIDLATPHKAVPYYKNSFEINQARMSEWEKLNEIEKDLVNNSFPILYGIRPMENRKKDLVNVSSTINGEIGITGGVSPQEIRVIFVPHNRIAQVKALIEGRFPSITIEAIEVLYINS